MDLSTGNDCWLKGTEIELKNTVIYTMKCRPDWFGQYTIVIPLLCSISSTAVQYMKKSPFVDFILAKSLFIREHVHNPVMYCDEIIDLFNTCP